MKQPEQDKLFVITANELLDGQAVFYGEQRMWTGQISASLLFEDKAEAEAKAAELNHTQAAKIVGAYVILVDGAKTPIKHREALRTTGPTNYWHGKQEEQKDAYHV